MAIKMEVGAEDKQSHNQSEGGAVGNGHKMNEANGKKVNGHGQGKVRVGKTGQKTKLVTPAKACTGLSAVLGLFLIVGGVLIFLLFRDLITSIIRSKVPLAADSKVTEKWIEPPVTPILRLYFFNFTNPDGFLQGEKPKLNEWGPYVYRQKWKKVNITWLEDGREVSYGLKKTYRFAPDLSVGSEDDELMLPNVPMITAVGGSMHYSAEMVKKALGGMLKLLNQKPFAKFRVGDVVWGVDHPLIQLGNDIRPEDKKLPFEQFGFFVGKNDTHRGILKAMTGVTDPLLVGQLLSYNGEKELNFWRNDSGQCNSIRGTDGSVFHPGVKRTEMLHIFNRDLCQTLPLEFQKDITMNGIPGFRFVPPADAFASPFEKPEHLCFCPTGSSPGEPGCQTPSGLFNLTACQFDSPIMLSWPHFFQADPKLLETVEGLNPNAEDHQFYIDIQPKLGTGLRAAARTQINVYVDPAPGIEAAEGLRRIILPVVWFSDGVDGIENKDTLALLRTAVLTPETARAIMYPSLLGLGGLILLVVVFVVARSLVRRSSNTMDVEVPMDTMEAAEGDAVTKCPGLNTSGGSAAGGDIPYADDDDSGEPVKNGGNGYAPVSSDD